MSLRGRSEDPMTSNACGEGPFCEDRSKDGMLVSMKTACWCQHRSIHLDCGVRCNQLKDTNYFGSCYAPVSGSIGLPRPTSTTVHQFRVEPGTNGSPTRYIYSVSTLSWLRSELKRLGSLALDSCSLVTSLSGLKRKTSCCHPLNQTGRDTRQAEPS